MQDQDKPVSEIKNIMKDEKELTRQGVVLDFVKTRVDVIEGKFDVLIEKIDNKYVTRDEFNIYKKTGSDELNVQKAIIAQRLDTFATKEEFNSIREDVSSLKDGNKWIIRLILGSIILAGLGLILVRTS